MNRKYLGAILAVMLLAVTALTGCTTSEPAEAETETPVVEEADAEEVTEEENASQENPVVATLNGESIYMEDYNALWEPMAAQYGVSEEGMSDPAYAEAVVKLQDSVLEGLVSEEIVKIELEKLGYYDLSDEDIAKAAENKDAAVEEYFMMYYEPQVIAELEEGYTQDEYDVKKEEYMKILFESISATDEELLELYKNELILTNAKADLILEEDLIPTDEFLLSKFDEFLQSDQELLEDNPDEYVSYVLNAGYTVFYTPEGVRNIKQVLISFPEENQAAIYEANTSGDEAAINLAVEEAQATIQEQAESVLAMLNSGEITIDQAVADYNEDPGMLTYVDGYPVSAGNTVFVPSFTEGAMALENIGDISGLVLSDFGYHILEYSSDLEAGPIEYSDAVKEEIRVSIIEYMPEIAWENIVLEWSDDYEIEYNYDAVRY